MLLQNVIFTSDCCQNEGLFFHSNNIKQIKIREQSVILSKGTAIKTDTYYNLFDSNLWGRYTTVKNWSLNILLSGDCEIRLLLIIKGEESVCACRRVKFEKPTWIKLEPEDGSPGIYYFRIESFGETRIIKAFYNTTEDINNSDIVLGINTCTYHRPEHVKKNLEKLKYSDFFCNNSSLYGKLYIMIVDNDSEHEEINSDYIILFHNLNTGGSGGFARGIAEYRKKQEKHPITHMIFMDDDIDFDLESFYRIFRFFSYAKDKDQVVAGRMFRTDQKQVQYTAAEIWNHGQLIHVGHNMDMASSFNLEKINDNSGAEYGGWWLCCYPMSFVEENDPFPFFLHCDDAEYGLRYGKTPLILNGVQVWHETYEYRQSDRIIYYDTRNPMIVNCITSSEDTNEEVIHHWKQDVQKMLDCRSYSAGYMKILAMKDFLRGMNWLQYIDQAAYHNHLGNIKQISKRKINFLYFFIKMKAVFFYRKAAISYKLYSKRLLIKG